MNADEARAKIEGAIDHIAKDIAAGRAVTLYVSGDLIHASIEPAAPILDIRPRG